MDRGAWSATVQRVAEADTTEVTYHTYQYKLIKKKDLGENSKD